MLRRRHAGCSRPQRRVSIVGAMAIKIRRGGASGGKGAWRREAVEFGALFTAAGLAHVVSTGLGHRESGSVMLVGLGGVLCVIVAVHLWWAHRRDHRPYAAPLSPARLWRVRAPGRDAPARVARLAAAAPGGGGHQPVLES